MDDLYKILWNLIENPTAPRFYRELRDHYYRLNKTHEVLAIDYLIEQRFGKKDASTDDSLTGSKP